MPNITGKTRLLGVIGYPIGHTLSPAMHNAAIAALGLDWTYLPFPVAPENLQAAFGGFEAIGLAGFNVTIPHKQAVLPLLAKVEPAAELVGAVNTVWYGSTGWQGTNTDVAGFIAPLRSLERDWTEIDPIILGSGGAARAVAVGCLQLGCRRIRVLGRDRVKLERFRASWTETPLAARVETHPWEALPKLLGSAGLVVNATPVGMHPKATQSPVAAELWERAIPGAIAYDLIYTPRPTLFLQQACARGAQAIDGLEMLVQQGAAALEIWLQQPVPVATMRAALLSVRPPQA